MGDRGQVLIKDTGVYLYSHWGATELVKDVQTALKKRWRWDDEEYLARIIFDVMVGESQGEETSFGIGTEKHGDIWILITVDCGNQTVKVEDYKKVVFKGSFEEFLKYKEK